MLFTLLLMSQSVLSRNRSLYAPEFNRDMLTASRTAAGFSQNKLALRKFAIDFADEGLPATEISPQKSETPKLNISPVDTMQMSFWEKMNWGRHGLFRTFGIFRLDKEHPLNDFRQMARVRRKMLSLHQTLGLLTWLSMAVTVYGGQRAIDGHSSSLHTSSLPFTIGLYTATASMALFSPPKLVPARGGGLDTVTFHKIMALIHVAGMLLTPALAPDSEGGNINQHRRHLHQISGYITFSAFTAGMLIISFFK